MTDEPNTPEVSELKIVSINSKLEEVKKLSQQDAESTKEFNKKLVELYAITRELFSNIEDVEIQYEAVQYLRKSFLLALNPLQKIDDQFGLFWLQEDE